MVSFFLYSINFIAFASTASQLTNQSNELIAQSKTLALHEHPRWKAILHVINDLPIISNTQRYLSGNNFSLQNELILTIELIFTDPENMCNYPARISFLQKFLDFKSLIDLNHCVDYLEFLKKVPAEDIFIVYASENVNSASSMLGHIMLRMDGTNDNGLNVSHGITFFTELEGVNVPLILYESLITGKDGVFQIAPYGNFVNHYLNTEQRNIWEYKLKLTSEKKQLIRDIAWELGRSELPYFFHLYNCATVTQLLVSSAIPEKISDLPLMLTPLDVVRFVEKNNMVANSTLIPSAEWELRAIIDSLPVVEISKAKNATQLGQVNLDKTLSIKNQMLTLSFYQAYNKHAKKSGLINDNIYQKNIKNFGLIASELPSFQLDVGEYKSPTDASLDGQFQIGWKQENNHDWLQLGTFPVASALGDQKKHVFGETTLTLSSINLLYSPKSNNLKLDNFVLYAMHSRVPYDETFKRYSLGFQFGLERQYDQKLNSNLVAFMEGQFGRTYEFTNDIGIYAETALGIGSDISRAYVYARPQLGAYIYLIGDIKLRMQHGVSFNEQKSELNLKELSLLIDWQIARDLYFTVDYIKHWNNQRSVKSYGMKIRQRF